MCEAAVCIKHIYIICIVAADHNGGTDKLIFYLGVHLCLLDLVLVLDVDDEQRSAAVLLHGGQVQGAGHVGRGEHHGGGEEGHLDVVHLLTDPV